MYTIHYTLCILLRREGEDDEAVNYFLTLVPRIRALANKPDSNITVSDLLFRNMQHFM
jgi:hypothetical protein